jgi:hypothetical protein
VLGNVTAEEINIRAEDCNLSSSSQHREGNEKGKRKNEIDVVVTLLLLEENI